MSRGGLSARLMRWVASMFGSFRASLPLTSLGFAAVFGAISGATTASVAAVGSITYPRLRAGRLQRTVRVGADRVGMRARQPDPALDRVHPLRHRDRNLGRPSVRGRHHPRPGARRNIRDLHLCAFIQGEYRRPPKVLLVGIPGRDARRHLAARRHRGDLRRHLFRRVLADRGGRRVLRLRDLRRHGGLSRGRSAGLVPERRAHAVPHRHILPDRLGRRHVRLAADHQRRRPAAVSNAITACRRRLGPFC